MPYSQMWILPRLTEGSEAKLERVHNTLTAPRSIAYFCPFRGEIWARRICMDGEGKATRWMVYVVPHPDEPNTYISFWPSGTLLNVLAESDWIDVPRKVLEREFLIYFNWAQA